MDELDYLLGELVLFGLPLLLLCIIIRAIIAGAAALIPRDKTQASKGPAKAKQLPGWVLASVWTVVMAAMSVWALLTDWTFGQGFGNWRRAFLALSAAYPWAWYGASRWARRRNLVLQAVVYVLGVQLFLVIVIKVCRFVLYILYGGMQDKF